MQNEFLNREAANKYYINKSEMKDEIEKMTHRSIARVFPGRRFVLYSVSASGLCVKVFAALRANVITMDKEGLCVLFRDVIQSNDHHLRVGYVPKKIQAPDGQGAFVAIPSHCNLERTLRRAKFGDDIRESTAAGIMIWQEADPKEQKEGQVIFSIYEDFKKHTKRSISALED